MTVNNFSSYFNMHLWVRIHVVKQLLIIDILLIPLQSLVIAEVISKRDKKDLAAVEFGLFAVLVQEQVCPAGETRKEGKKRNGVCE